MAVERRKQNRPYQIMMLFYLLFVAFAFALDSPQQIISGFWRILTSRGILITDYMAIGGVGATLINAAATGMFSVLVQMRAGVRPNGATLMAMWLTTGFAMFGKNLFNLLPISFGVWLYSRYKKEPFMNYTLVFLLSSTCSPVVSGICFHPMLPLSAGLPIGILAGIAVGFLFAPISAYTNRVHGGYNLYNMGFAGGIISTFLVSALESVGFPIGNELHWSDGHNLPMAVMVYIICVLLIAYGLFGKKYFEPPKYRRVMASSGRLVSDFLILSGHTAYFNMGLLGILSTTLLLLYGANLNGPTICGIFTVIGFGAFGKHLRNVWPLLAGAILCTYINRWDVSHPMNILAILFATGLSPIAGQYGWAWGVLAGFLHVNTVMHIGFLNSGLNLYNNGYAAGFVAILMVPAAAALQRASRRGKTLISSTRQAREADSRDTN